MQEFSPTPDSVLDKIQNIPLEAWKVKHSPPIVVDGNMASELVRAIVNEGDIPDYAHEMGLLNDGSLNSRIQLSADLNGERISLIELSASGVIIGTRPKSRYIIIVEQLDSLEKESSENIKYEQIFEDIQDQVSDRVNALGCELAYGLCTGDVEILSSEFAVKETSNYTQESIDRTFFYRGFDFQIQVTKIEQHSKNEAPRYTASIRRDGLGALFSAFASHALPEPMASALYSRLKGDPVNFHTSDQKVSDWVSTAHFLNRGLEMSFLPKEEDSHTSHRSRESRRHPRHHFADERGRFDAETFERRKKVKTHKSCPEELETLLNSDETVQVPTKNGTFLFLGERTAYVSRYSGKNKIAYNGEVYNIPDHKVQTSEAPAKEKLRALLSEHVPYSVTPLTSEQREIILRAIDQDSRDWFSIQKATGQSSGYDDFMVRPDRNDRSHGKVSESFTLIDGHFVHIGTSRGSESLSNSSWTVISASVDGQIVSSEDKTVYDDLRDSYSYDYPRELDSDWREREHENKMLQSLEDAQNECQLAYAFEEFADSVSVPHPIGSDARLKAQAKYVQAVIQAALDPKRNIAIHGYNPHDPRTVFDSRAATIEELNILNHAVETILSDEPYLVLDRSRATNHSYITVYESPDLGITWHTTSTKGGSFYADVAIKKPGEEQPSFYISGSLSATHFQYHLMHTLRPRLEKAAGEYDIQSKRLAETARQELKNRVIQELTDPDTSLWKADRVFWGTFRFRRDVPELGTIIIDAADRSEHTVALSTPTEAYTFDIPVDIYSAAQKILNADSRARDIFGRLRVEG